MTHPVLPTLAQHLPTQPWPQARDTLHGLWNTPHRDSGPALLAALAHPGRDDDQLAALLTDTPGASDSDGQSPLERKLIVALTNRDRTRQLLNQHPPTRTLATALAPLVATHHFIETSPTHPRADLGYGQTMADALVACVLDRTDNNGAPLLAHADMRAAAHRHAHTLWATHQPTLAAITTDSPDQPEWHHIAAELADLWALARRDCLPDTIRTELATHLADWFNHRSHTPRRIEAWALHSNLLANLIGATPTQATTPHIEALLRRATAGLLRRARPKTHTWAVNAFLASDTNTARLCSRIDPTNPDLWPHLDRRRNLGWAPADLCAAVQAGAPVTALGSINRIATPHHFDTIVAALDTGLTDDTAEALRNIHDTTANGARNALVSLIRACISHALDTDRPQAAHHLKRHIKRLSHHHIDYRNILLHSSTGIGGRRDDTYLAWVYDDPNASLRAAVVEHAMEHPWQLAVAATDPDPVVRLAVAERMHDHPQYADPTILATLATDTDPAVAETAKEAWMLLLAPT